MSVKDQSNSHRATYEIARTVDQEQRISDVVAVTGRILKDKDGVVWKIILVDVGNGQHILSIGPRSRTRAGLQLLLLLLMLMRRWRLEI